MRNRKILFEKFLLFFVIFLGTVLLLFNRGLADTIKDDEEIVYLASEPLIVLEPEVTVESPSENILIISEENLITTQPFETFVEEEAFSLDFDLEQLKYLAAVIYCESSATGTLEDLSAVGWVVYNRVADSRWHYSSIKDAVMAGGQFTVTQNDGWNYIVDNILTMNTERSMTAVTAAMAVMLGEDVYRLPEDVQFFCAGETKEFGGHEYYATLGGNSFFRR